mmetsp:Transcript_5302/g.15559  ORF Transcript_5302/g.15559 Transcript_5302/m.15559 type:complete len:343 (+) Transcript_5302:475-1503(+)
MRVGRDRPRPGSLPLPLLFILPISFAIILVPVVLIFTCRPREFTVFHFAWLFCPIILCIRHLAKLAREGSHVLGEDTHAVLLPQVVVGRVPIQLVRRLLPRDSHMVGPVVVIFQEFNETPFSAGLARQLFLVDGLFSGHSLLVEERNMPLWDVREPRNTCTTRSRLLGIASLLHLVGLRLQLSPQGFQGSLVCDTKTTRIQQIPESLAVLPECLLEVIDKIVKNFPRSRSRLAFEERHGWHLVHAFLVVLPMGRRRDAPGVCKLDKLKAELFPVGLFELPFLLERSSFLLFGCATQHANEVLVGVAPLVLIHVREARVLHRFQLRTNLQPPGIRTDLVSHLF